MEDIWVDDVPRLEVAVSKAWAEEQTERFFKSDLVLKGFFGKPTKKDVLHSYYKVHQAALEHHRARDIHGPASKQAAKTFSNVAHAAAKHVDLEHKTWENPDTHHVRLKSNHIQHSSEAEHTSEPHVRTAHSALAAANDHKHEQVTGHPIPRSSGVVNEHVLPQMIAQARNAKRGQSAAAGRGPNGETKKSAHVDRIHGGKADRKQPADFDRAALEEGRRHEAEHTDDPTVAQEIAMDHLTEDPGYYKKLKKVEKAEDAEGDVHCDVHASPSHGNMKVPATHDAPVAGGQWGHVCKWCYERLPKESKKMATPIEKSEDIWVDEELGKSETPSLPHSVLHAATKHLAHHGGSILAASGVGDHDHPVRQAAEAHVASLGTKTPEHHEEEHAKHHRAMVRSKDSASILAHGALSRTHMDAGIRATRTSLGMSPESTLLAKKALGKAWPTKGSGFHEGRVTRNGTMGDQGKSSHHVLPQGTYAHHSAPWHYTINFHPRDSSAVHQVYSGPSSTKALVAKERHMSGIGGLDKALGGRGGRVRQFSAKTGKPVYESQYDNRGASNHEGKASTPFADMHGKPVVNHDHERRARQKHDSKKKKKKKDAEERRRKRDSRAAEVAASRRGSRSPQKDDENAVRRLEHFDRVVRNKTQKSEDLIVFDLVKG